MLRRRIIAAVYLLAALALLTLVFQGSALAECTLRTPGGCINSKPPADPVPELDLHTIGAGLMAFGGASALLVERYRRRKR